MRGFHSGGSKDNEAEVENLLSQLEDESLLKLRADTHRKTEAFASPAATAEVDLDDNLLIRFANLKSRGPRKQSDSEGTTILPAKNPHPEPEENEDEDEDVLASQLEERLKALKAEIYSSSGEFASSPGGLSSKSSRTSSGSSKSSRSFSPLKMMKQLSMGRRTKPKSSSAAEELISSVAKEIAEEKKKSSKDVDEGDDEDFGESLLNDLDLKKLKKELNAASGEEDRISREAQQVIEWARDAARLKTSDAAGVGDESDSEEELLQLGEHGDEDEDGEKLDSPRKKKKKGKKWSLF